MEIKHKILHKDILFRIKELDTTLISDWLNKSTYSDVKQGLAEYLSNSGTITTIWDNIGLTTHKPFSNIITSEDLDRPFYNIYSRYKSQTLIWLYQKLIKEGKLAQARIVKIELRYRVHSTTLGEDFGHWWVETEPFNNPEWSFVNNLFPDLIF